MDTQTGVTPPMVEIPRRGPSRGATVVTVALLMALVAALRLYRVGAQPLLVD